MCPRRDFRQVSFDQTFLEEALAPVKKGLFRTLDLRLSSPGFKPISPSNPVVRRPPLYPAELRGLNYALSGLIYKI